jgi:orotidine-5'-phosphate decarboxylase
LCPSACRFAPHTDTLAEAGKGEEIVTFLKKLDAAVARNQSLLCVGLDPSQSQMAIPNIAEFNAAIIEATKDLVCAYKPQMAFYEAQGIPGLKALEKTLAAIPSNIPVILDGKRGDIGNTARAYAKAMFENWGADATTVHPYMGGDSLEPFLDYADKGVIILTRTSNPGGADLQGLEVESTAGRGPLYHQVAHMAQQLNTHGNVGLVVGATYPAELGEVRAICPEMPILVPGVGAQGGDLEASIRNGVDAQGRRAIINVSRGIIYASKGANFAEAARREAESMRARITATLQEMDRPW